MHLYRVTFRYQERYKSQSKDELFLVCYVEGHNETFARDEGLKLINSFGIMFDQLALEHIEVVRKNNTIKSGVSI